MRHTNTTWRTTSNRSNSMEYKSTSRYEGVHALQSIVFEAICRGKTHGSAAGRFYGSGAATPSLKRRISVWGPNAVAPCVEPRADSLLKLERAQILVNPQLLSQTRSRCGCIWWIINDLEELDPTLQCPFLVVRARSSSSILDRSSESMTLVLHSQWPGTNCRAQATRFILIATLLEALPRKSSPQRRFRTSRRVLLGFAR